MLGIHKVLFLDANVDVFVNLLFVQILNDINDICEASCGYESTCGRRVLSFCGSPPGVIVADTLSFNAKMDLVDF